MTRKGKIARLPLSIREQINRRLQNGDESKQIAEWLNVLPEVIAVLAAEFDAQPINDVAFATLTFNFLASNHKLPRLTQVA